MILYLKVEMIEYSAVASENEQRFEKDRVVAIKNDGKFSLTQLWELILRNKRLPGRQFYYF